MSFQSNPVPQIQTQKILSSVIYFDSFQLGWVFKSVRLSLAALSYYFFHKFIFKGSENPCRTLDHGYYDWESIDL